MVWGLGFTLLGLRGSWSVELSELGATDAFAVLRLMPGLRFT